MWVFGYGSLMWDGWQTQHGCTRQMLADLPGYSRAFNKASVRNWGSTQNPCPTLSLTEGGNCRGMAFEFPATANCNYRTTPIIGVHELRATSKTRGFTPDDDRLNAAVPRAGFRLGPPAMTSLLFAQALQIANDRG